MSLSEDDSVYIIKILAFWLFQSDCGDIQCFAFCLQLSYSIIKTHQTAMLLIDMLEAVTHVSIKCQNSVLRDVQNAAKLSFFDSFFLFLINTKYL